MMASAPIPLTDVSYTTVNQVAPNSAEAEQTPLQKFLKGEPKAMGVVQIMIGLLMIMFGIVMALPAHTISVFTGVVFWGSLIHIIAGSLAVSASNKLNACVLRAALVLNILSTIAAGIAIIILSLDLLLRLWSCGWHNYDYDYRCLTVRGITGVLLVFSVLQFVITIAVSAFTCKATCIDQPTLNIISVAPNPASGVHVVPFNPAYQA